MQIAQIQNNSQNFKATITTYKLGLPNKKGKCKYRPKTQKIESQYDKFIKEYLTEIINRNKGSNHITEGCYSNLIQYLERYVTKLPSLWELPISVRSNGLVEFNSSYNKRDNKSIGINFNIPNVLNVYVKL